MQSRSVNVAKLVDHPRILTMRINSLSKNLSKVGYSTDINDLANARVLPMPQIWDCLREGTVQPVGLVTDEDEARGTISHHSHEGLVRISFCLTQDDSWLEVLSASIEVK